MPGSTCGTHVAASCVASKIVPYNQPAVAEVKRTPPTEEGLLSRLSTVAGGGVASVHVFPPSLVRRSLAAVPDGVTASNHPSLSPLKVPDTTGSGEPCWRISSAALALGFVCASALSGASISGPMLITGRALQGAFGGLLVPSSRSLLVLIFHEPGERARALGVYTAVLIGGAIFGFILSGVITNYLDWRWTLYVNVPVAVVVALGVVRVLPDFPGDARVRIDVPGVVLGAGGMVALVYGLSEAATVGWGSSTVAGVLAVAVALLVAFVVVESHVVSPLLPLRVLLDRNRAGAFIALGSNSFANFGMLLVVTYELQTVMHATPLATGFALVPGRSPAASARPWSVPV
jgi:MFS family permease